MCSISPRGQAARGHRVGLIVDAMTGGARADAVLAELAPELALGLQRVAIARELGPSDFRALRAISPATSSVPRPTCFMATAPKARRWRGLRRARRARSASTRPHGGSLVYRPGTIGGGFYRSLEWLLKWRTDLFLFESALRRRPVPRPDRPPAGA